MSIFEFMSNSPWLSFFIVFIVFGSLSEIVKYLTSYKQLKKENKQLKEQIEKYLNNN